MNGLFIGYMIGYLIAIGALWWGLRSVDFITQPWPSVIALALVGLGIVYALSRAQTDSAQREQARSGDAPRGGRQGGAAQGGEGSPQQQQQRGNPPQGQQSQGQQGRSQQGGDPPA